MSRPCRVFPGAGEALRRTLLLLVVVAAGLGPRAAFAAESDIALERRVKAAFIYQFIPYVEWPPRALPLPDSPIVIAVVGPEAAVAELEEVVGKRNVQGRQVLIRRWRDSDTQGGPHIVFVTRTEERRLPAIARAAQSYGALVVSEHDGALEQGGMINFRLVDGRVRFDIALGPVERAGLRISSRLLTVAQSVRPAHS